MSKVKTQIYGIKGLEDALMCCELGADHVGIGFGEVKHLGPNQKSCAEAKAIFDAMPEGVVKVGLTIATDVDEIIHDLSLCMPDVYHLSGDIRDISPEGVQRIRDAYPDLKIMQALPVIAGVPLEEQEVLELVKQYEETTDFFLIDTKDLSSTIGIGATGAEHDRSIDRAIIESTSVPCIIAGGLDADNIVGAILETRPYGVDSCTRTSYPRNNPEGKRGKDPEKVKAFIDAAHSVEF